MTHGTVKYGGARQTSGNSFPLSLLPARIRSKLRKKGASPMSEKKKNTVTSKDIARECGVSQATVSYVINNKAGKRISEEKRQEILEAARRLNYFPNASARSIRQQSCTSVGLLPGNNYTNAGFGDTLRGIKKHLDSIGYTLTLLSDDHDPENTEILRYYYSNIICGVIYIAFDNQTIDVKTLEDNSIPYVVISENGVSCRGMEEKKAFERVIFDCVRFCRDHQLKTIRYFTRAINGRFPHNKYDLLMKAIQEIYPECDFKRLTCVTTTDGPDSEVTEPIRRYLESNTFDIALTPNQRFGLLMQRCLLQNDFSIPQKIKHICLASSPALQNAYPRISSLYIPLFDMGFYAAKLLISLVNEHPIKEQEFECRLVHGDTTRFS